MTVLIKKIFKLKILNVVIINLGTDAARIRTVFSDRMDPDSQNTVRIRIRFHDPTESERGKHAESK
jgi:hypothetical protein